MPFVDRADPHPRPLFALFYTELPALPLIPAVPLCFWLFVIALPKAVAWGRQHTDDIENTASSPTFSREFITYNPVYPVQT